MRLNTFPACFEGSGTGEHEKKHKTLKHLKLGPKKQLGMSPQGDRERHRDSAPNLNDQPASGRDHNRMWIDTITL